MAQSLPRIFTTGILESIYVVCNCHVLSSLFVKNSSLSTDDLNNFCPISNLNFIFKILEKVSTSHIQSHLSSNSLSSFQSVSFLLLKLLFSKFTMTSSLQWIMVRSLHSFSSTYLLLLILSIIPSFSLIFKIGLGLMVFLLIGSCVISHLALRQSPQGLLNMTIKQSLCYP